MPTRRSFLTALLLAGSPIARGLAQDAARGTPSAAAGRKFVFRIKLDGFGGANENDIKAVLRSAAEEIWQHCPNTRFTPPGFEIYHDNNFPITHYARAKDGYIVIGLAVEGNLWARFAFQFAHEFAHALMDHSNDAQKLWHQPVHANQWLEESICETASLFSLRAMARTWQTTPPYPNWKGYASALGDYASKRQAEPAHKLPEGQTFGTWFATEEPAQRKDWTREKNTIIARELLPLFETNPAGWEALPYLKLGSRDVNQPLAKHLAEWHTNAPADQRAFIANFAAVFGVKL